VLAGNIANLKKYGKYGMNLHRNMLSLDRKNLEVVPVAASKRKNLTSKISIFYIAHLVFFSYALQAILF